MSQLIEVKGKLVQIDGELLTINNNIARLTSKSVSSAPDKELESKVNEIASNLMDTIIALQAEIDELKSQINQ